MKVSARQSSPPPLLAFPRSASPAFARIDASIGAAEREGCINSPSVLQLRMMSATSEVPILSHGNTGPAESVETADCSAGASSPLLMLDWKQSLVGRRPMASRNSALSPTRHCSVPTW